MLKKASHKPMGLCEADLYYSATGSRGATRPYSTFAPVTGAAQKTAFLMT